MHPNQYFDRIYLINLDRRKDRLSNMQRRLAALNIEYTRVTAYDALQHDILPMWGLIYTNEWIYRDAIARGLNRILIIEDDCIFHNDFLNLFSEHAAAISEYDIWFFGAITPEIEKRPVVNDYFTPGTFVYTTTAMAYRVGFLHELLEQLSERIKLPIDCFISERIVAEKFVSFVPKLVVQDNSDSDIEQSNQDGKTFDKTLYNE